jgi:hypothetical protein
MQHVRTLDIEKLLQWAFREELPKQQVEGTWGYSASPLASMIAMGTAIDASSYEPGFPAALGTCDPDAEIVGRAVLELEDKDVDWPQLRQTICEDIAALVSEKDPALAHLTIGRAGLISMHAKMGTRPRATLQPLPEPVIGRNGKPLVQYLDDNGRIIDGRKNRHYGRSARCPLMWFPAPREAAFARVEYFVWHSTLNALAGVLRLQTIMVLPPAAPAEPWRSLNHHPHELAEVG